MVSSFKDKPRFVGEKVAFADAFSEVSRGVRKFKQKEYSSCGAHPIIDQGQEKIAGYSDEEDGLFSDDKKKSKKVIKMCLLSCLVIIQDASNTSTNHFSQALTA